MISKLKTVTRYAPYIAAAIAMALLYVGTYYAGKRIGAADCVADANAVVIEQNQKTEEIRNAVQNKLPPRSASHSDNIEWLREHFTQRSR